MGGRWLGAIASASVLVTMGIPGTVASAQEPGRNMGSMTVLGSGEARACSDAAIAASRTGQSDLIGLIACGDAIDGETMSLHDLAATHVNRGILYVCRMDYLTAMKDYDEAVAIEPGLGDAYTNRGAALIAQRLYAEGIADIDHGMTLPLKEPEKAYYNRAIGRENLGDTKGAYLDFLHATELKPDWAMAKNEVARFTVTKAGPAQSR